MVSETSCSASYAMTTVAAGLLDVSGDGWLRLFGKDTKSYLHRMVSSHVEKLATGEGRRGLLLNVKGHIEADVLVLATAEDEVVVLVPELVREKVREKLEKFIIMDEVTVEDLTGERAAITVQGPRAGEVIASVVVGTPPELARDLDHAAVTLRAGEARARLVRRDRTGLGGFDVVVPREWGEGARAALLEAARAIGGGELARDALDVLRVEAGLAVLGRDFGEDTLPQEARLDELGIVAFDKCYIGQEVVSRLHFRGHANRLLSALRLDVLPPTGARLEKDAKDVGRVTSAVASPRYGRPIGLGYVRREHASPGNVLEVVTPGGRSRAEVAALDDRGPVRRGT